MLVQPRQLLATSKIFHWDIDDFSSLLQRSDQELAVANTRKYHNTTEISRFGKKLFEHFLRPSLPVGNSEGVESVIVGSNLSIRFDQPIQRGKKKPPCAACLNEIADAFEPRRRVKPPSRSAMRQFALDAGYEDECAIQIETICLGRWCRLGHWSRSDRRA